MNNCLFEMSDYISVVSIFVNSALAIWIVITIQKNIANKRVLKDHFIQEVKDIRKIYAETLNLIYSGRYDSKQIIPWLKLMNIKVTDCMALINQKYEIDKDILKPYQSDLRFLITENDDFIRDFSNKSAIKFSEESKMKLIKFQQENNHIFNDLIILINDAG